MFKSNVLYGWFCWFAMGSTRDKVYLVHKPTAWRRIYGALTSLLCVTAWPPLQAYSGFSTWPLSRPTSPGSLRKPQLWRHKRDNIQNLTVKTMSRTPTTFMKRLSPVIIEWMNDLLGFNTLLTYMYQAYHCNSTKAWGLLSKSAPVFKHRVQYIRSMFHSHVPESKGIISWPHVYVSNHFLKNCPLNRGQFSLTCMIKYHFETVQYFNLCFPMSVFPLVAANYYHVNDILKSAKPNCHTKIREEQLSISLICHKSLKVPQKMKSMVLVSNIRNETKKLGMPLQLRALHLTKLFRSYPEYLIFLTDHWLDPIENRKHKAIFLLSQEYSFSVISYVRKHNINVPNLNKSKTKHFHLSFKTWVWVI